MRKIAEKKIGHSNACADPRCEGVTIALFEGKTRGGKRRNYYIKTSQPCANDRGQKFYSGGVERKPFQTKKEALDYIAFLRYP